MQKTEAMFNRWNDTKKKLQFSLKKRKYCRVGEFWRYYEGVNLGSEISKDRPFKRVCLILKTNNKNGLVLVIPATTKHHKWLESIQIPVLHWRKFIGLKESRLLLNQVKFIDRRRLEKRASSVVTTDTFIYMILKRYTKFLNIKK